MSNTSGPQGLSCYLFRASMIKFVQAAVGPPAALRAGLSFSGGSTTVPGRAPAQEPEPPTSDWQLQAITASQPPASVLRKSLSSPEPRIVTPPSPAPGTPEGTTILPCRTHVFTLTWAIPRGRPWKICVAVSRAVSGNTSQGESTYTVLSKS